MKRYSNHRDLFWLFILLGLSFFVGSFFLDGRVSQSCCGLISALLFAAALGIKSVLDDLKKNDNEKRNRHGQ